MTTVMLHVGHPKTGSSHIQSMLALSGAALTAAGIHYPASHHSGRAQAGRISSGNYAATGIIRRLDEFIAAADGRRLLFSAEQMFAQIASDPELLSVLAARGCSVQVLLMIRNPVEFLLSEYQQMVKRKGYAGTMDDYIAAQDHQPRIVHEALEFVAQCEAQGADLRIVRYGDGALEAVLADWLGADPAQLVAPEIRVNRSLSFFEVELLRLINRRFGQDFARPLADALVEECPAVAPERIYPAPAQFRRFLENCQAATETFDSRYGARYARYGFDPAGEQAAFDRAYGFAQAGAGQMAVLCDGLADDTLAGQLPARVMAGVLAQQLKGRFSRAG